MPGATTFDRVLVAAAGVLIALFAIGTVRDDDRNDDRDSDDSRSPESNTTRGTGPSNMSTRDTNTGTRTR